MPKTVIFNFRVLPFNQAIKLPIYISNNIKIGEISKNIIQINSEISKFMIRLGSNGSDGVHTNPNGYISFTKKSKIIFNGFTAICDGASIRVGGGVLEFGENFTANKNFFISCGSNIKFGNNVMIGWNVNIRDSDGHFIIQNGQRKERMKAIEIGNHVWICSYVDILKGVNIGNDNVIAYGSKVIGSFDNCNLLVGGFPAKIISENINWEKQQISDKFTTSTIEVQKVPSTSILNEFGIIIVLRVSVK